MPIVAATPAAIESAAHALEAGELVGFPTETVYGLGADAENPVAVANIYAAKGRPANHPVIVHVAPGADLGRWAAEVPAEARALVDAFWPGPLTLILKRASHVPDAVSGGQDTIGLRCPSHPVAQALLRAFKGGNGGVAAPSANRFGHVSPTTAEHVRDEFGDGPGSPLACILDGGASEVGIESTIVDLSRIDSHGPVLLRPGGISIAQLEQVLGVPVQAPGSDAPRASGTLEAHYAPGTPVALVDAAELAATLQRLHGNGQRVALLSRSEPRSPYPVFQIDLPPAAEGYAHDLYAALREADEARADLIVVEAPPQDAAWAGVNDRLRRAAHDSRGVLAKLLG
ncbi:MAG TPA: L-threonylcarbamoyladenylate synthase [Noviherbaspirillum sp.]|nr:L-threonylcarbamoyladenylate synthase [Noviherbaspirillum sp.]